MKAFIVYVILTVACVFVPISAANEGCTPQQVAAIAPAVSKEAACLIGQLASIADDPLAIVAACAGTTLALLDEVITELLGGSLEMMRVRWMGP